MSKRKNAPRFNICRHFHPAVFLLRHRNAKQDGKEKKMMKVAQNFGADRKVEINVPETSASKVLQL